MKDLVEFDDNVVALMSDGHWNPHSDVYARNEEQMVDWEGNMVEPKYWPRILLDMIETDEPMVASLKVSRAEVALCDAMDKCSMHLGETVPTADWDRTPHKFSASDGHLHTINPVLDPECLAKRCLERWQVGNYSASVGSIDDDPKLIGQLELDKLMASSTDATSTKGS